MTDVESEPNPGDEKTMTNKARLSVCSDAVATSQCWRKAQKVSERKKVYFRLACILHLIRT